MKKRKILTISGTAVAAAILSSSAFADLQNSIAAHVYVNVQPNVSVGVLTGFQLRRFRSDLPRRMLVSGWMPTRRTWIGVERPSSATVMIHEHGCGSVGC